MLNWAYVTDPKSPEYWRKGARLAQAIYGHRSRFAIVELRKFGNEIEYAIADAEAAGDAWYSEGKLAPLLPDRYNDPAECVRLIDAWSARRMAELSDDGCPDADFLRDRQQDEQMKEA